MVITKMETGVRHYKNASCKITICMGVPNQLRAKCRELVSLDVPENLRRTGMATELVRQVTEEADKHNMLLVLFPEPFGEGPKMSQDQLVDFYSTFGFQSIQARPKLMMARMPHSTPGAFKVNEIALATFRKTS
jgi:N-acetylglutamate synthase-like GNAT family acetyltransferase